MKALKISFTDRVYDVVKDIPKGKTLSYGQVATLAGSPGAARAVGNALHKNKDPKIPCHRVIRSNGVAGGYNQGFDKKIEKLKREGALPIS